MSKTITERIAMERTKSERDFVVAFVIDELENAAERIERLSAKVDEGGDLSEHERLVRMVALNDARRCLSHRIRELQDEVRGLGA